MDGIGSPLNSTREEGDFLRPGHQASKLRHAPIILLHIYIYTYCCLFDVARALSLMGERQHVDHHLHVSLEVLSQVSHRTAE